MHILFLNGSEFRGSWREFTRALWHPLFIGLVLGMTGVIFLIQPYDDILPTGVMLRTLIVVSCVAVFLGVVLFGFSRFAHAKRRAHTLAVILPGIVITSVWGVGFSVLTGGNGLAPIGWAQLMAFNFVLAIFAEVFLASFLLHRIMVETGLKTHPIMAVSPSLLQPLPKETGAAHAGSDASAVQATEQVTAPQHLKILEKSVALNAIWHLKAEEHYVSLTLRCGTSFLLRGRLADAIAQVPADMGLQVHRSHWVARSALTELDRKRDGWRLRLRNGTDIPVARNRQAEVRDWVEAALQAA